MEYQEIVNLLDTTKQPSKSRTKNLVEIGDNTHRTYTINSQIKF